MHSMTGYGTATGRVGRGVLYVEIKTVNHRYCEVALKLPPRMGPLEGALRDYLQGRFERGRIECYVREVEPVFGKAELNLDLELARSYQKALGQLRKALKIQGPADPLQVVGLDHFVRTRETSGDYLKVWSAIHRLAEKAVRNAQTMRLKEGGHLLRDQCRRLKQLAYYLARMEKRAEANRKNYCKNHAPNGTEGNQVLDKMDLAEELTRLQSHTKQYRQLLNSPMPVGRKLDFLIQEMHREVNTVGAKAADAKISRDVVETKSLLENLREQVQNIL